MFSSERGGGESGGGGDGAVNVDGLMWGWWGL